MKKPIWLPITATDFRFLTGCFRIDRDLFDQPVHEPHVGTPFIVESGSSYMRIITIGSAVLYRADDIREDPAAQAI